MSPEELPRPKGPKVEVVDRRGKLMAFKQSVRKDFLEEIAIPARDNETPYERLKRLETDPAANLKELQEALTHFVPHLQLIEIEMMLSQLIPIETDSGGKVSEAPQGLYALLLTCRNYALLREDELILGHQVRSYRNELFHGKNLLSDLAKEQIATYWANLRDFIPITDSTSIAIQKASVAPLAHISNSQLEAGRISHLAAFIEIEQMLRKTMNHVLSRNRILRANFVMPPEPPGSIHAMAVIRLSRGLIIECLKNFRFWDDIKASITLRHELIHGRNLSIMTEKKKLMLRRVWGVLRHLPYALWANKLINQLEMAIREILISDGIRSDVVKKLWIQRLSRRLCYERRCMALLANGGVGLGQILWLINFSDAIYAGKLEPITAAEVAKLQEILRGIAYALKHLLPHQTSNLNFETKHAPQMYERKMRKHSKQRRNRDEDDF